MGEWLKRRVSCPERRRKLGQLFQLIGDQDEQRLSAQMKQIQGEAKAWWGKLTTMI